MKLSLGAEKKTTASKNTDYVPMTYIKPGITNAVITEFRMCTPEEQEKNWNQPYISVSFLEPATGSVLTDRWGLNDKIVGMRKTTDLQITTDKVKHLIRILSPGTDVPHELDVEDISKMVVGPESRFKFSGKESLNKKKTTVRVFAFVNFPPFCEPLNSTPKMTFSKANSFDYRTLPTIPNEKFVTTTEDDVVDDEEDILPF